MALDDVRAVAFDLDWTLVRSTVDFTKMKRAVIAIFQSHGVDRAVFPDGAKTNVIARRGRRALTAQGAGAAEIAAVMTRVTAAMNQVELERVAQTTRMPGAATTVRWVRRRGLPVGVLTRGCREYADAALCVVGLRAGVDVLLARDEVDHPKPDPRHLLQLVDALGCAPGQVVLVGDSTLDAACAQDAGAPFVGVATGVASERELSRFPHRAVIPRLADLIPLLQPPERAAAG
jgi:phosphoglycolate phosphatase-like HAD superfamily hydrolase